MALLLVHVCLLFSATAMFSLVNVVPMLYSRSGMSQREIGWLQSSVLLLQLFVAPFYGKLVDKYNVRVVMIFSLTTAALANVALSISNSVPSLIAARILSVLQDFKSLAQMYIVAEISLSQQATSLSRLSIPFTVAMIFGIPLSNFIRNVIGMQRQILLFAGLPFFAMLLVVGWVRPLVGSPNQVMPRAAAGSNQMPPDKNSGQLIPKNLSLFLTLRFLSLLPNVLFAINVPLIFGQIYQLERANGVFQIVYGVLNLVCHSFLVSLMTRIFSVASLIILGSLISFMAYLYLSFASSAVQSVEAFVPIVCVAAAVDNVILSQVGEAAGLKQRSTAIGVCTAIMHLIRVISPLLGGFLVNEYGIVGFGAIGMFCMFLSLALGLNILFNDQRKGHTKQE